MALRRSSETVPRRSSEAVPRRSSEAVVPRDPTEASGAADGLDRPATWARRSAPSRVLSPFGRACGELSAISARTRSGRGPPVRGEDAPSVWPKPLGDSTGTSASSPREGSELTVSTGFVPDSMPSSTASRPPSRDCSPRAVTAAGRSGRGGAGVGAGTTDDFGAEAGGRSGADDDSTVTKEPDSMTVTWKSHPRVRSARAQRFIRLLESYKWITRYS